MSRNGMMLLCIITIAIFIAGCGAASAPPIDLPAPVVGRIDSGGPSDSGKATVAGGAGAVEADSIVMGINERLASETANLWNLTDLLFKSAHAQSLPSICSQTGHACALSSSDGSFSLEIDAVVNDSVILVLIDSNGNERSPRTTIVIPSGSSVASCEGESVSGALIDLRNVGGVAFLLFEGNGVTPNTLTIGAEAFEIPGCYAKDLAVYPIAPDDILIAAVSGSDHILWVGEWNGTALVLGKTFTRGAHPYAVAFDGDPNYALTAELSFPGQAIHRTSLLDGTSGGNLVISYPEITMNDVLALRTIGPFADGGFLGAVIVSGPGTTETEFYLSLFQTDTLINATSGGYVKLGMDTGFPSMSGYDFKDGHFGPDITVTNTPVLFMVSDYGNQAFYVSDTLIDPSNNPVFLDTTNAADLDNNVLLTMKASGEIFTSPTPSTPKRFALGVTGGNPMAYIVTSELNLWRITGYDEGSLASANETLILSGAVDPISIGIFDPIQSLLVGDAGLPGAVDYSPLWGSGL